MAGPARSAALSCAQVDEVEARVARRLAGEPLQYVIGSWSFRHLELSVDPRVLIPRPETEGLVDEALRLLRRLRQARPDERLSVADLGTGSGAIALSLAAEGRDLGPLRIWASDCSPGALEVAAANLARLDREAREVVRLCEGHWWQALPEAARGTLDLVVSNPPYLAPDDEVEPTVSEWEPAQALWSGSDGLEATRGIIEGAPGWLRSGGYLLVEIASTRAGASAQLAAAAGWVTRVVADLAGRERLLVCGPWAEEDQTGPPGSAWPAGDT